MFPSGLKTSASSPLPSPDDLERRASGASVAAAPLASRGMRQRLFAMLPGKDTAIAILAALAILGHLFLRYVLGLRQPIHLLPLFFGLAAGGVPLVIGLLRQALKREFGSDLLAGFSIVTGILLHEYLVACIVVLMLSGGSALEQYATRRASSALRALAKRMPTTAHLVSEGRFVVVNAQSIVPDQVIAIFPHEVSPVDGEVIEGYGDMDESYLTGEPFHISKAPGSQVLSGAVNGSTVLKVRAAKLPVVPH